MRRPFRLVDVFAGEAFAGNPLAVVHNAEGLDAEQMMRITRWLNLSETAFLLAPRDPGADYRVRIFTLERELPFAGHPTLGSCHAWLAAGGRPREAGVIVQECGAGAVRVRREGDALAFAAPPLLREGPVEEARLVVIARALGIERSAIVDAQWGDNGPGWIIVLLDSARAVLDLEPVRAHAPPFDVGVVGLYPPDGEYAYELRAFFSDHQGAVREDPVTGSLNASAAQWMIASARVRPPYLVSQGARAGHAGRIRITRDAEDALWVGGTVVTRVEGEVLV